MIIIWGEDRASTIRTGKMYSKAVEEKGLWSYPFGSAKATLCLNFGKGPGSLRKFMKTTLFLERVDCVFPSHPISSTLP